MCKLKKDEFFHCRRCREEFIIILKDQNDPAIIADKILTYYSFDIVILVLAANILAREDYFKNSKVFKLAKRYENKIGFLMGSIKFNISAKILEKITEIILRRFPNE